MATAMVAKSAPEHIFEWEGKDRTGKLVRGELRAGGEAAVSASMRRQGIMVTKVKKRRISGGSSIKQKDIAVFTRQLSTMMRAGVPLLQAFDIVARGSTNPRMTRLLNEIRGDVETGTSLSSAFRKHPQYFDALYCNLVEAGEAGGILEELLARLALYQEKTIAIKQKVKSALIYPTSVIVVAFAVLSVIMIFVIPSFKEVFTSFGAELPAPTLVVMAMSDYFIHYWWLIFGVLFGGGYIFFQSWKRSEKMQFFMMVVWRSSTISSARCFTRAALVAKRSSVAHADLPATSQNLANWPSLPTARIMSPSAVGKSWYGTMLGCALPMRRGTLPPIR